MSARSREKKITTGILDWCEGDLTRVTPGLRLQAVHKGRLAVDLALGETYEYYDLASLTKILFAAPAFMSLCENGGWSPESSVAAMLGGWKGPQKVTLKHVLSHSAGLLWWEPYYKTLAQARRTTTAKPLVPREALRTHMQKIFARLKFKPRVKCVYSDLDLILLGFALEEIAGLELHEIWERLSWREFCEGLHFNPGNKPKYKRESYAPTEKCPWRGKVLQGEVHDDNTWAFGGVSTHAGLFGTVDDVTKFGQLLRAGLIASPNVVQTFTRRAVLKSQGDWAMGFMLPTKGSASCGKYFSSQSYGHTGFTGTSLWYDPKRDLLVSLLSNRVHPTRENALFAKLRPEIHNLVVESLR